MPAPSYSPLKFYAGIGSRKTPREVRQEMYEIAQVLGAAGYRLRSGGAEGADRAFQRGAEVYCVRRHSSLFPHIYKAEGATKESIEMAAGYHPNWDACNTYARRLHGRNSMIILGRQLDKPVDFIVCWTEDGKIAGGTGQALRMAKKLGIPVHNLAIKPFQLPLPLGEEGSNPTPNRTKVA